MERRLNDDYAKVFEWSSLNSDEMVLNSSLGLTSQNVSSQWDNPNRS